MQTTTSNIETTPRHRKSSQGMRLLRAYKDAGKSGLTPEEAAIEANVSLRSCYWKRVSEMLKAGYLLRTKTTRTSDAGGEQRVLRITPAGRAALKAAR